MEVTILAKLKPLYANLLRLKIANYLITSDFDHFALERNLDNLWAQCEKYVRNQSNVAILIPGYTGYAEEALAYFIENIYQNNSSQVFVNFIKELLTELTNWSGKNIDVEKIISSLENLGIAKEVIDEAFIEIPFYVDLKSIPEISEKPVEFNNEIVVDKNLCFVLMPFSNKFDSIYLNIVKKTIEKDFKLNCKRADELFGSKPIIEDIWEFIKKANFLIADLSDRNPNVFYELGIAHALKKDVILITQDVSDVPFDLRHFRCIVYEDSIAGAESLKEGLKNFIKQQLKT